MTGVTITFTDTDTINIANATGASVTFAIAKLLTTGVFDTATSLVIGNGANADHNFTEDGIYRIWNPTAAEGNMIIISADILSELETDVKEILLSDDLKKELPKSYDFVTLVLMSIMFIGNSPYQNVLYSAGAITNYTTIAVAIDRCETYFDKQNNTPQSTNKIWQ